MSSQSYDAVVLGAGFFGCEIAAYLRRERGFRKVLIVEQEGQILNRASRWNQARVHGGYHYPRDFVTAHRSRVSRPLFVSSYPEAIVPSIRSFYAIARQRSHVRAETFLRRMKQAGADLQPAPPELIDLFSPTLIETLFEVNEQVFDVDILRESVGRKIRDCDINLQLSTRARGLEKVGGEIAVTVTSKDGAKSRVLAPYVFNCTYSGLNVANESAPLVNSVIKHEIAELTLLEVPDELKGLAITIMDGPFFSLLPYPPEKAYSLSHVRYTPKLSWQDDGLINPYEVLRKEPRDSRSKRMVRDAARFIPTLAKSQIVGSFQEVKTVLVDNEANDGRPILIEKSRDFDGLYSVLGGKIDNIFDCFDFFESVNFDLGDD